MGYSLVAIWPGADEVLHMQGQEGAGRKPQQLYDYIQEVARKATQCALDCKREIFKQMGPKIKVIFGICHGDFQVLHMGGMLRRIEFFVSGSAYQQALSVMRASRKRRGGSDDRASDENIAVSTATWSYIKDFFIGESSGTGSRQPQINTEAGASGN